MEKTVIKFGNIENQKQKFDHHKRPISIKNVDINKRFVSGFKYFIGYKDSKKIRPLCIFVPKMSAYRKDFDDTRYISFFSKR